MYNKKDNIIYYVLLNLIFIIYSFSAVSSKLASKERFFSWKWLLFYGISIVILFGYAVVWQRILKRLPLVNAYANKAVTVIWGIVWGKLFFHETITIGKIAGAIILGIGIYFVVLEDKE